MSQLLKDRVRNAVALFVFDIYTTPDFGMTETSKRKVRNLLHELVFELETTPDSQIDQKRIDAWKYVLSRASELLDKLARE